MPAELLLALCAFALVSSITPGPNNLMLMSSGANFGFKRTLPHMLGVGIGFSLMVFFVGIGLAQLFTAYPISYTVLKVFSVVYLVYLAYKIATSAAPEDQQQNAKPISFLQAAAFQWVNPKAWSMALTAVSVYSPSNSIDSIALVALIFGLVNIPSVTVWTMLGQQLQNFLTNNHRLRIFNGVMASLLIASIFPVLS